jgi:large subunit ribosomal protein L15
MASKVQPRAFTALSRSSRYRPSCSSASIRPSSIERQRFSTTLFQRESQTAERPRWKYTPPGMKAPISLRSDPSKRPFKVNSDPQVLDEYYIRMLGNGGEKMLSEEVKWQAVTHKSFDQGRRGYNDRLAFLGTCCKRIFSQELEDGC